MLICKVVFHFNICFFQEKEENLTVISNYVDGLKTFGEAEALVEHYAELNNDPRGKSYKIKIFKRYQTVNRRSA